MSEAVREQLRLVDQEYTTVRLADVTLHPDNPRKGDVGIIGDSIAANGFYGALVVQKATGHVLAGNHRLLAAQEAGAEELPAIVVDVDDDTALRILLADNRTSDVGVYDAGRLLAALENVGIEQFAGVGYSDEFFDDLRARTNSISRRVREDEVPPPPREAKSQPGVVYELGAHRLLCGDATDLEMIDELLAGERPGLGLTDPPYNVDEDYETYDDDLTNPEYAAFTQRWFPLLAERTVRQIVTPGWNNLPLWCRLHRFRAIAAWTKSNAMTRGSISQFNTWEPILFFGEGWQNRVRASDVFDVPVRQQPGGAGMPILDIAHPCPKPVELWADLVEIGALADESIFDPFCGAGTALIAAENLGRRCYGIELDPAYCDVIRQRYADYVEDPSLAP